MLRAPTRAMVRLAIPVQSASAPPVQTKTPATFSLQDKYRQVAGTILLTGIQALVRLPMDQQRADRRRGLHTGTLISGYRGSPLGGLDLALQQAQQLLAEHQIIFLPGVNEDLAATAVTGSQLAHRLPKARFDGVLGLWYGKAPGLDRSGDALKHANFTGVGRHGGVLAVVGDDPVAKSSTLPSASEAALYDAQMPILYPGSVQEILDLGRLGFELSRYSGCWVGFKMVTDVADSFATAEVAPDRITVIDPGFVYQDRPWRPTQNPILLAPQSVQLEQEVMEGRLEAAKRFAAANDINRIVVSPPDAWLGLVAAGKIYYDLREALQQMGMDDDSLHRYGIRLLKLGMLYPLEPELVRAFARDLEEIFVIEEKRSFIELFLREILYGQTHAPRIVGKRDEQGTFLVPSHGELDVDTIGRLLTQRLASRIPHVSLDKRKPAQAQKPIALTPTHTPAAAARTPYFCSGCPHNRSLQTPADSLVGAGIGCHTMVVLMDQDNVSGITHMGGEGVQWAGASLFTDTPHLFQNMGDGTLFHSGTLAIRQAVAANTNITYKILYNDAVAMTGGQAADGKLSVPALTRLLDAEGVRRTIVVSADLQAYPPDVRWGEGVEVWKRARLQEAQRVLQETPGVTALIYDQECAANLRRKRRRGKAPDPPQRVLINEAVCEGCGDCGVKSNCLSVYPVETEFGRKTQIHQASCNRDYTCLEGDCPAFITAIPAHKTVYKPQPNPGTNMGSRLLSALDKQPWPEPVRKVPSTCNIYMMGVGGTGVVTANQILGTAARLDGMYVHVLDQTGLSQKGGPVVSNLKLLDRPQDLAGKVAAGAAHLYLAFDLLTAATEANLRRAHPDHTFAVVSTSRTPTGAMVRSPAVSYPAEEELLARIDAHTRTGETVHLDATAWAESLFGSHMPANLILIGAAYQAGLLPISAASIERAIELNGVQVESNRQAFQVGRQSVADREWAAAIEKFHRPGALTHHESPPALSQQAQTLVDQVGASGELRRLLEIRVPALLDYQNLAYAQDYVDFVATVFAVETRLLAADKSTAQPQAEPRLSQAVARYLFKLMAYKDEYEVARLHLMPEVSDVLRRQFGADARIHYQLHPPLLRSLGLGKLRLGTWIHPLFHLLVWMRRLRGTWLDIFGYPHVRQVERTLIHEYRTMVEKALAILTPQTYARICRLAELPDLVRGYEEIKLKNVERYRNEVEKLQTELDAYQEVCDGI